MDEAGIVDVELRDAWLRVHFGPPASTHADYHYLWLRHNLRWGPPSSDTRARRGLLRHFIGRPAAPGQYQYRFRLGAGDFLMYDNFRMLHARTAFSGPRWVRGVYFTSDDQTRRAVPTRSSP